MKIPKKYIISIIVISIILLGDIGFNVYNNGWGDFLKINAYEVLTIIIALFVTYYLTERKNDIRKLNDKVENICNDIQVYLRENYKIIPSKQNKERVLMNIRYISNKAHILEKLSEKNNNIKEAVSYIKKEHDKYNEFVSTNLDQDEKYFLEQNRLEKIRANINNMDNKLDEIIVYLYTGQVPTIHSEKK